MTQLFNKKMDSNLWIDTLIRIPNHSNSVYVTILTTLKEGDNIATVTYVDRAYMQFERNLQPKGWYVEHIDDPYKDKPLEGVIAWMEKPKPFGGTFLQGKKAMGCYKEKR